MKRKDPPTSSQGGKPGGYANGNGGGNKDFKKQARDDEPSFEELMMMEEEWLVEEKIEGGEGDETGESRWSRKPVRDFDSQVNALSFQWLDIDMTSGEPLTANPDGGKVIGSLEGPVPVIRLYGVTHDGHSVLAHVHGFTPYFYILPPQSMDLSDGQLGILRNVLDQRLKEKARSKDEKRLNKFVLGIERAEKMQSLLGYYHGATRTFLKVCC